MCQVCGCTPCEKCGGKIENEVCAGCGKSSTECACEANASEMSGEETTKEETTEAHEEAGEKTEE